MVLRTKGVLLALLGVGGSMGGRGVSPGRAKRKANTFLPSPCHLGQSSLPELELFIEHDQNTALGPLARRRAPGCGKMACSGTVSRRHPLLPPPLCPWCGLPNKPTHPANWLSSPVKLGSEASMKPHLGPSLSEGGWRENLGLWGPQCRLVGTGHRKHGQTSG